MSNRNRKRAFGSNFRTLHDITNGSPRGDVGFGAAGGDGAPDRGNIGDGKIAVHHVPSLPDDDKAAAILRRIHSEFRVLIERRGWRVTSITEMCCCGDGIDCLRKGGRKTRTMPDNVLGYNRTGGRRSRMSHDIHLRLRHPRTHALFDYESVAGTMCHELAHCVRGPHDAIFYRAMEEIEEQYAVYLARGVVLDKGGFPVGGGESHVLGGGGGGGGRGAKDGRTKNVTPADRRKALEAAESRRGKNRNGLTMGYLLGGKSLAHKDPREAARIAAERRLLDDRHCLPCDEIIEILGEDSSGEGDSDCEVEVVDPAKNYRDGKGAGMKPKAKKVDSASDEVVDLTLDDSFTSAASPILARSASRSKRNVHGTDRTPADADTLQSKWTCLKCTLDNPCMALVCYACHSERPCKKTSLEQAKEFQREDDIASVKEKEVQQSKELFGGFNIYGETRNTSSTMNHLT